VEKANSLPDRTLRFLSKQARKPSGNFEDAPDERQAGKVTHAVPSLLWALELGLISNQPTLRDVEAMTARLAPWGRSLVPEPISDTTLDMAARALDPAYLSGKLVEQVREAQRSKSLRPVGLPFGVAVIDGKNLATLDHDADGTGHERSSENKKWHQAGEAKTGKSYYLMPALRATLTSAESKPCIYQYPLPPGTGESTACPEMVDALHAAYGRGSLFEVLDLDAGLTSLANADHIDGLGYGYVFGLKGNQAELYAEAQALLAPRADRQEPEAKSPWERRNGKRIRRLLWRTDEMRGFTNSVGCWSHLRQTWLVRQETEKPDGQIEVEDRYFISSQLWNRLRPVQILALVRSHWGVENDTFNSLDLQWREDHAPWCTKGNAIWGLGLLRLMAYNVAQLLRRRRLRRKDERGGWKDPMSWRQLFKNIERAVEGFFGAIREATTVS